MNDYEVVNDVYGEYFEEPYPARAAFEVSVLPTTIGIEIAAVAILK